jgi:hypothetical protein
VSPSHRIASRCWLRVSPFFLRVEGRAPTLASAD